MVTFMGILKKHKLRCSVTTVGPLLLGKGFCHGWLMGEWGFKIPHDQRVSFAQRRGRLRPCGCYFPKKNHKISISVRFSISLLSFLKRGGARVARFPFVGI
jgi:hypothetical protein